MLTSICGTACRNVTNINGIVLADDNVTLNSSSLRSACIRLAWKNGVWFSGKYALRGCFTYFLPGAVKSTAKFVRWLQSVDSLIRNNCWHAVASLRIATENYTNDTAVEMTNSSFSGDIGRDFITYISRRRTSKNAMVKCRTGSRNRRQVHGVVTEGSPWLRKWVAIFLVDFRPLR